MTQFEDPSCEAPRPFNQGEYPMPIELRDYFEGIIGLCATDNTNENPRLRYRWSSVLIWNYAYLTGADIEGATPQIAGTDLLRKGSPTLTIPHERVFWINVYRQISMQNNGIALQNSAFMAFLRLWGIAFLKYNIDSDSD